MTLNVYRCATCARRFTAYAPAERHADTHRGARIENVLHPEHPVVEAERHVADAAREVDR